MLVPGNGDTDDRGGDGEMYWSFKSCGKCNGDLCLEGDEWRCLQCGQYYYTGRPVNTETALDPYALPITVAVSRE